MTSMVLYSSRSTASCQRFLKFTYRRIVLLYLKGRKTLSKRNVLKIENLKNDAWMRRQRLSDEKSNQHTVSWASAISI